MEKSEKKIYSPCKSNFETLYMALLFVFAGIIVITNQEIYGTLFFIAIISLTLILTDDFSYALYPILLLSVFVTRCYNSYDIFIKFALYACVPIYALIFHFIFYKKKFSIGPTFYGVVLVAIAVTFGGCGQINFKSYSNAVYYVLGLGIGMILFYLEMKPRFGKLQKERIAKIFFIIGFFVCFCILRFYISAKTFNLVSFQSSNNLATILMICIPFAFYYTTRNFLNIFSIIIFYFCLILCGSRGGLLMGSLEFVLLLLIYSITTRHKISFFLFIGLDLLFIILLTVFLPKLFYFYGLKVNNINVVDDNSGLMAKFLKCFSFIVHSGEARIRLLNRSFGDFLSNILFGRGLGYQGNSDIYKPVSGAMNWYHMWFPQIIGSMGLVGLFCYGFQFIQRINIYIKNRSSENRAFFCGYLGLFLMTQVNPGEFCPIPYAMIGVLFFILIENSKQEMK